jgi:hypothetical protein
MFKRAWWVILVVLAAVILGVTALQLKRLLVAEPNLLAAADPACDLSVGPCTARFPGDGEVTLSVEPRGIPVLRPLVVAVATRGLTVSGVAVDFAGVDMNMGYNRPSLTPAGPGLYRGEGMLPICAGGPMDWEARVLLTTERGLLAAPFRFETAR